MGTPAFWGQLPGSLDQIRIARQFVINCLQPFSRSTGARFIGRERHALVVCSLSIIPPVPDLTGTPLCLEADYTDLPRPDWADLVKEVATGMTIVPAEMSVSVGLEALRLLDKLSKIVGWKVVGGATLKMLAVASTLLRLVSPLKVPRLRRPQRYAVLLVLRANSLSLPLRRLQIQEPGC